MNNIDNNKRMNFWIRIVVIVSALVFLVTGFAFGYLYGDKSCIEDPLIYGVKQLNEFNNDKITCTCYSSRGLKPLMFNEEGVIREVPIESLIQNPLAFDPDLPLNVQG